MTPWRRENVQQAHTKLSIIEANVSQISVADREIARQTEANNRFTVAAQLEERILTGKLRPGDRLPEMTLARDLGVSQASMREALQELESRGLIVKYPNRGSFVIELDTVRLLHIFQVRRELEPLACALLAGNLPVPTLALLQQCVADMRAAAERSDYPAYLDADLRFHRAIWAAQPNRVLEKSLLSVCLPLFAYDLIRHYKAQYANNVRAVRQHQMMITAMQTDDVALVRRLTRRLVDRWFKEVLADYNRTGTPPSDAASLPPPMEQASRTSQP